MKFWLVKSEPFKYSWDRFLTEGKAGWDGVRNFQARNNLREMKTGDLVLFYHSNEGLAVVGMARVEREAYQDPTTPDPNWVAVDLVPAESFARPVTLAEIKSHPALQNVALVRQGRLSVMSLAESEFDTILTLSKS